jgi:predicted CXXCH cytochrome family protein
MGRLWIQPASERGRHLLWMILSVGVLVLISSCLSKAPVFPIKLPAITGAQQAGSDQCGDCHVALAQRFQRSEHYRSLALDEESRQRLCESCHGAGSLHVDKAAEVRPETRRFIFREKPEACFNCHLDIRAQFSLPYRHPVMEGRIRCSSCHDIHGEKRIRRLWSLRQETCFECHPEIRGPFVWEHEAVKEGCENCHSPHGSPLRKLLTQDGRSLCLKCHVTSSFPRIGSFNHRVPLSATARCVDCHTRVHGSNFNRFLLSQ